MGRGCLLKLISNRRFSKYLSNIVASITHLNKNSSFKILILNVELTYRSFRDQFLINFAQFPMLKELYFQNQRSQPILLFDIFVKNN